MITNIRISSQDNILNEEFRKETIKALKSTENINRKKEAEKRYEVYKDKTQKYVAEKLKKEGLKEETVCLMLNRAANVSVLRKIVNKLSRAYLGGVQRTTQNDVQKAQIDDLSRLLDIDHVNKKADRYLTLQKNCAVFIYPDSDELNPDKYGICMKVCQPSQFDVLVYDKDPTDPIVFIVNEKVGVDAFGVDICRHIWWSQKYHFTTDEKGVILPEYSPEDNLNPIQILPFVSLHDDQEYSYWAEGGNDLTDGCILINTLLTDMFSIQYMQGWGQLVITGDKIPEKFSVGPHHALIIQHTKDDPTPSVQVVSQDPQVDAWLRSIEQYVALLLSTNNLSPTNIAMKLDAQSFPSGIAMLIEQSESTDSVVDRQKYFKQVEREEWEIIFAWQNYFAERSALDEEFAPIGSVPEGTEVAVQYTEPKPVVSESEKLDNIKKRQDLGINTQVELIMIDNPDLTLEEAEKKLLEIKKENIEKISSAIANAMKGQSDLNNGQENQQTQL